jgi:isopentenyl phosphate kinase
MNYLDADCMVDLGREEESCDHPNMGSCGTEGAEITPVVKEPLKKDRVPLLFVDVNLGNGEAERIVVYEGDRSEQLAEKFAKEQGTPHSYHKSMIRRVG